MSETSSRFGFPFIIPGQAQKEVFHNEALAAVDSALHPCIENSSTTVPPASPVDGQSWIVAAGGTGIWAGKDGLIATWTQSGWRFTAPVPGMLVWNKAAGVWLFWSGAAWSDGKLPATGLMIGGQQVVGPRLPEVLNPSGGTTIDTEARGAIAGIIVTLKTHGLIN